ncbi:hypothetical protein, partial [Pseudomonas aeruginosa]|uniref:hypothetical protein n=1 Tax=Pseudomonas aeruginosa TaxID=287 RepID=UPI003CC60693
QNPRNRGGSTGHVLAKRSVTFTEIRNRSVVDQAIIALRERVKTPSPEHAADNGPWLYCDWQARQTAYRLLQRLERATR